MFRPQIGRAFVVAATRTLRSSGNSRMSIPLPSLFISPAQRHFTANSSSTPPHENDGVSGITVSRTKGKQTGYCYGCGADLVKGTVGGSMATTPPKQSGYWKEKQQELKISKIKNWALCPRCKQLNRMEQKGILQQGTVDTWSPDSSMMHVFRTQVSKIRTKPKAVVVLCLDATNVTGSFIGTIRNYVGGNPILLAVTRCDLLPDYVWESITEQELRDIFAERARDILPAEVYLCSIPTDGRLNSKSITGGVRQLIKDLFSYLNGRDTYIVGSANIGKSTLTDVLIEGLLGLWERSGTFVDRLDKKRIEKLQDARVTKSALPGTTLQNVRVPCFPDHMQALWDTPGLLLDESTKHFPIRNFRQIRAQRPEQIQPCMFEVPEKKCALLICEPGDDDDTPLLRMEIRLKREEAGGGEKKGGPIRLVWNSTLSLNVSVVSIQEAVEAEEKRKMQAKENTKKTGEGQTGREEEQHVRLDTTQTDERELSEEEKKEEKARRKAEKRQAYLEKVKQEQSELGKKEWKRLQKERDKQQFETQRTKILAELKEVDQVICEKGHGTDIAVANFGWLGILPPATAKVSVFAPSLGVRVRDYPTLALPSSWGDYKRMSSKKDDEDYNDDDELWDEENYSYDEDEVWDEDDYDEMWDEEDDYGSSSDDDDDWVMKGRNRPRGRSRRIIKDPWEKHSGEHVGWQFDADTRWSKGKVQEGWNPVRKKSEEVSDHYPSR